MNRFRRCSLVVVCVGLLSARFALAQDPPAAQAPQTAGARQPRGPRPNPTNIKALPKTITGDEVIKLMHQYEGDLGVECEYCHARNPETKRNDFPSDTNPIKDKARLMIKMTDDLNTKYLAQLTPRPANPITCGTCHRGMAHPEVFVPKPHEHTNLPPSGASAAPSAPPLSSH